MLDKPLMFEEMYLHFYRDILTDNKTKREADFIIKQFDFDSGDQIADIPCGYGRHSIEIAKRMPFIDVNGLDISKYYLDIAENKKTQTDLSNVNFIQYDMRKLDFVNKFKLITCLYTSFGYFNDDENIKILQSFHNAIKHDGYLFLETININSIYDGDNVFAVKGDDRIIDITKKKWNGCIEINRNYIIDKKEYKFDYILRLYTINELSSILSNIGFTVEATYGDYTGIEYTENSPRMIIVAKKA